MTTPMVGQLEGKVAIVTGAGSGLGQAAALLLAKAGTKIAALASSHISGTAVWIDGAQSLLPG